jgi:hypothetical protein
MEQEDAASRCRDMLTDKRAQRHIEFGASLAALVYVVFGLTDMSFSLLAFQLGFRELNPILAWAVRGGLFIPAKIAMTVGIGILIAVLYSNRVARVATWSGILVMTMVTAYHLVGLSAAA